MADEAKHAEEDLPDPDYKVILLGDSAVGKSKLVERYLMDDYNPRQVREAHRMGPSVTLKLMMCIPAVDVCVDIVPKRDHIGWRVENDNRRCILGICVLQSAPMAHFVKVDFWDTAGQETFNRMHPSYYYRAHCCILGKQPCCSPKQQLKLTQPPD